MYFLCSFTGVAPCRAETCLDCSVEVLFGVACLIFLVAIFVGLELTLLSFLVGKVRGAYTTVPQPVFLLLSDKRGSRVYV